MDRSIDARTIGINSRIDFEFNDFFFLHNSITRGWRKSTQAKKWDIKSTIGVNLINGLGLAYGVNFINLSKDYEDKSGNSVYEESNHLYNNFSIIAIF